MDLPIAAHLEVSEICLPRDLSTGRLFEPHPRYRMYVTMDERDEESEYIMRLTCWLEWIAESCWFNIRDLEHYVSRHG